MASPRRGFNRERHTALKLAVAGLAFGGFSLAWAGFAASHPPAGTEVQLTAASSVALQAPTSTPAPARTPVLPPPPPSTSSPTTSTPAPIPTAAPEPTSTPAPRSVTSPTQRRTRGS